jgi:hypothetical protein
VKFAEATSIDSSSGLHGVCKCWKKALNAPSHRASKRQRIVEMRRSSANDISGYGVATQTAQTMSALRVVITNALRLQRVWL